MAAVGKLPPICRAIEDVYREAVVDAVMQVGDRLHGAVEMCLREQPEEKTPEQALATFTRCLSARLRVLKRLP